jgi:hypothetical protein
MSRRFANIFIFLSVLAALAILGGLAWANMQFIRSQPVEKNFLVPWLGARSFLQYGENPYETPATQRAQIVYYGRLAQEGQDPLILWLPFPVELFYFPFALISDYVLARAVWMTCLEIALITIPFLLLKLTKWNPSRTLLPLILLSSIFWVYGALSLTSGSGAGFIALALAGFLLTLRDNHDEVAGALLLLTGGLLSFSGLLVFFMLWRVIYQRHWRILWGFLMTLILLLALSFLFLPNWLIPFVGGVISHTTYNSALSLGKILASWSPVLGPRVGWVLTAVLLLLLFVEWGAALRNEFRHVLWTISLTISVMPLMGLPISLNSYAILIVPLLILLGVLGGSRSHPRIWGWAGFSLILVFILLWVLAVGLVFLQALSALPGTLFLLLPFLLISGLYWMRWRFTRPVRPQLGISV